MSRSQRPRAKRDPQSLRERILKESQEENEKNQQKQEKEEEYQARKNGSHSEKSTTKNSSKTSTPEELDLNLKRELIGLEFYRTWNRATIAKHSTTEWGENRIPQHNNQYSWEAERNGFARWVVGDTNFKEAFKDSFITGDPEMSYLIADSLYDEFKYFCKKYECRQYLCHAQTFRRSCRQKVNEYYARNPYKEDTRKGE